MIFFVADEQLAEARAYVQDRQENGRADVKLTFQPFLGQHVLSAPGKTNSVHAKLSLSVMETYA